MTKSWARVNSNNFDILIVLLFLQERELSQLSVYTVEKDFVKRILDKSMQLLKGFWTCVEIHDIKMSKSNYFIWWENVCL